MEAREFVIGGGFLGAAAGESQYGCENRYLVEHKSAEHSLNANNFTVDELLDFSKHDEVTADDFFDDSAAGRSSTVAAVDSCKSGGQFSGNFSCGSFTDTPFSTSELCIPYDDLAELEWLSNFVEDSFSSDEVQNLQLILATKTSATAADSSSSASASANCKEIGNNYSLPAFPNSDVSVPGKARSKRSRAAPWDWSSRILLLSPEKSQSESKNNASAPKASAASKRRESCNETQGRKCLHCASEKTPQWRTGPMGPKTLCNACGVRYKSGRLVPEYRPAASPTFVSTKHSNSHRKVLELRRQNDLHLHHQQQLLSQASIFGGDAYLLHRQQSCGPDYTHMI
ncbi:PREDICTED: GATA transcription factor 9-like [Ipomoea nil]|uniref:GATA transcription factor 9-like n=1 Tax=Ipomoea nil TaxID=35883 RepID=UPI000901C991|nr:PREDICTED: GATA transcription factor 9-like [Ipomoea nil]